MHTTLYLNWYFYIIVVLYNSDRYIVITSLITTAFQTLVESGLTVARQTLEPVLPCWSM